MTSYDPHEIEERWQERWTEEKVFEAEPTDQDKFFITVPYPYLNGNLHAGHTRTFTIGDVIARYKRMLGYNVLFPMGFHVTGTPIVGLSELVQKRDPQIMKVYTDLHRVPEEELLELTEPERIVDYFSHEAQRDMRSIGYSIDWRRRFTTTDEAYKQFIRWQYNRLHKMDYVAKGSHPVRWCPNDQNPVEDHDILRGEDANIVDYTLIKFNMDDTVLPCATLRPETVYGVTNLWVDPEVTYRRVSVDDEEWIVSHEAYQKLTYTDKKVDVRGEVSGHELIGRLAKNPVTETLVPILPAGFVDPTSGSGVVMSVPAHAPYDYLALRDLTREDLAEYDVDIDPHDIKPISLIDVEGFGEYPAVEVTEEMEIESQEDPKAEEATKIVYRREFHGGRLKDNTGEYAGTPVSEIKDELQQNLIDEGVADIFYEFSEYPVVCRCGTNLVVKVVKDQWFVTYSKSEWKDRVLECLNEMDIIPEEMRKEFENKVDWLKDKAGARRKGLGTRLPWDREWLIESLGDSTIYMAYYTLAKYVNDGTLEPGNLTQAFLDYVLLGLGTPEKAAEDAEVPVEVAERVRGEFKYWYPVDLRSSGKDLVANHLLFFLFHHVALFPESLWPRAIAVNGFVSLEGEKMSKSKGPLLTMKEAVNKYGADVTRLYIVGSAEHTQDADWRRDDVEASARQVERLYNLAQQIDYEREPGDSLIDRWMMSRLQHRIRETRSALDNLQTRRALQNSFYLLFNDVRWYQRRGGEDALARVMNVWLRLLAPFTPHVAEELWRGSGFVSLAPYPEVDESLIDPEAERAEELVREVLGDAEEILRVTRIAPEHVYIYTAPEWKREMLQIAEELRREDNLEMGTLMQRSIAAGVPKKQAPKFAQDILKENKKPIGVDEHEVLSEAADFLSRELGAPVTVQPAEEPEYDPENKSRFADPGRPAIYVEGEQD